MSIPSSEEFYARSKDVPQSISQGDIFLCPSSAFLSAEGHDVPNTLPPPPKTDDIGTSFLVRPWEMTPDWEEQESPDVVHEVRWGLVMVISHECDIQKDFNALARREMKTKGLSVSEVNEMLGERVDLDRYVVVSPVLTYAELKEQWTPELCTEERVNDVRRGNRNDFFPLPAWEDGPFPLPESVVSFVRFATVERRLLQVEERIASLSEEARSVLRYQLGQAFSFRDVSVMAELEEAVGQRIEELSVTPLPPRKGEKKGVSIALHLENGEVLHLKGEPIREGPKVVPGRYPNTQGTE